ncbi:response regulator transcription factor [Cohnella algarum]|uniref:response regulator transcription factor n=1 Tax=Cohnella algarum TaxID=2044859 RepID=UPI0019687CA3|nr:response regulator [Cohnella algarum]MBN2981616.1 response regulator [Cohnella algarum]
MKALIVDDETDVRISIRLLVNWDEFGITDILEASDGVSAMTLIREENPEIVFTDMKMPNGDGMELLQWIEAEAPHAKRIVISGYDDYTYIRNTLKHGGLDYLLKPINRSELLDTLRSAVGAWQKEEEERHLRIRKNTEINRTIPAYRDKTLSAVVSQPDAYRTCADELQEAFGWSDARKCRVAMLLTDPLPRPVLRKFGRNLDLLYFLMTNICNEIIGSGRTGYAFKHANPAYGIVLLFTGGFAELNRKLADMNDAFSRFLGARFHFACGEAEAFPEGIHAAFEKALRTARSVSYAKEGGWIHFDAGVPSPAEKQVPLTDYGSQISTAVYSGDVRRIEDAVGKWIEAVGRLRHVTWEHLQYWRYEFELLTGRLLPDSDSAAAGDPVKPSSPGLFPIDARGRLSPDEWRREWTEAFAQIAGRLKEKRHQEHNAIYAIKQFIETNYAESLSVQEIASRFFLSREYVSRRFKQEFNENISEYIERVRIENAKALLANGEYSVADVGAMVGYQDGRYFSKIFGKLTGMSPREYRKKRPI